MREQQLSPRLPEPKQELSNVPWLGSELSSKWDLMQGLKSQTGPPKTTYTVGCFCSSIDVGSSLQEKPVLGPSEHQIDEGFKFDTPLCSSL